MPICAASIVRDGIVVEGCAETSGEFGGNALGHRDDAHAATGEDALGENGFQRGESRGHVDAAIELFIIREGGEFLCRDGFGECAEECVTNGTGAGAEPDAAEGGRVHGEGGEGLGGALPRGWFEVVHF